MVYQGVCNAVYNAVYHAVDHAVYSAEEKPPPQNKNASVGEGVVCGCYIGKRNFDKALSLVPDVDVKFIYSTFQLNPDFPKEGVNRREYISRKFIWTYCDSIRFRG